MVCPPCPTPPRTRPNSLSTLTTLLLALPCHVQSSISSGAGQQSSAVQPRSLSSPHHHNQPRQLQVTSAGTIRGDLLISVPVSLLLPTLAWRTAYQASRAARSLQDYSKPGLNTYTGPLLNRLDNLFFILQVEDERCRERAICEIVQNREDFSPLNDFLINIFRKSRTNKFLLDEVGTELRWEKYQAAARLGETSGLQENCFQRFPSCPFSARQMLNLPALRLWQLAAQIINIRIEDY